MPGRTEPIAHERLRDAFERFAAYLEPQLTQIAGELAALYRREIPRYSEVSASSIEENTRATLEVALQRLASGQSWSKEVDTEIAEQARRWAHLNIPLEFIAHSFHVGARRLVELAREHRHDLALDNDVLFAIQDHAWDAATAAATTLATVQREHEVALARRDATRRADFMRELAAGRLSPERLAAEASAYGVDLDHPYIALIANCDEEHADTLEAHIRRSGATSQHRAVYSFVEGRLLALVARRPRVPAELLVASGPPALPQDVHRSFAQAEQALKAASAFGATGVVELTELGATPFVIADEHLARRLNAKHFADLDQHGDSGVDIEHTVRTLLDLDTNIDETARTLHLHRNSVRYRVTRFRELTDLDIRRTDQLVTAWLLLRWRQADSQQETPAPEGPAAPPGRTAPPSP